MVANAHLNNSYPKHTIALCGVPYHPSDRSASHNVIQSSRKLHDKPDPCLDLLRLPERPVKLRLQGHRVIGCILSSRGFSGRASK
jgi:hypothetical protein